MPNKRKAFKFYCKFMLVACEASEFKIPVEFPDGSIREVYFKVKDAPRLSLVEDPSPGSSLSPCDASPGEIQPRQKHR